MRAREPDADGLVDRGGVKLYWEVFGDGEPTVFLLPTWSIVHARCWKAQVPYLARHFRVLTSDGRGNGRSDRPAGAEAYTEREFAADALAVMDATATRRAVFVSLSCGALWSTQLAADHPDRVAGLAAATRGRLITLAGTGHLPQARHPVKVNLCIREFVESLGGRAR